MASILICIDKCVNFCGKFFVKSCILRIIWFISVTKFSNDGLATAHMLNSFPLKTHSDHILI